MQDLFNRRPLIIKCARIVISFFLAHKPMRIATNGSRVLSKPLQGEMLVPESDIGRQLVVHHREEAERAEPIVDRDL